MFPRLSLRLTELVTPLKPLEAMAQERIVAASNVGGHRELIRDRETGYLFPPDDPERLAEGVLAALDDEALVAAHPGIRRPLHRQRAVLGAQRRPLCRSLCPACCGDDRARPRPCPSGSSRRPRRNSAICPSVVLCQSNCFGIGAGRGARGRRREQVADRGGEILRLDRGDDAARRRRGDDVADARQYPRPRPGCRRPCFRAARWASLHGSRPAAADRPRRRSPAAVPAASGRAGAPGRRRRGRAPMLRSRRRSGPSPTMTRSASGSSASASTISRCRFSATRLPTASRVGRVKPSRLPRRFAVARAKQCEIDAVAQNPDPLRRGAEPHQPVLQPARHGDQPCARAAAQRIHRRGTA